MPLHDLNIAKKPFSNLKTNRNWTIGPFFEWVLCDERLIFLSKSFLNYWIIFQTLRFSTIDFFFEQTIDEWENRFIIKTFAKDSLLRSMKQSDWTISKIWNKFLANVQAIFKTDFLRTADSFIERINHKQLIQFRTRKNDSFEDESFLNGWFDYKSNHSKITDSILERIIRDNFFNPFKFIHNKWFIFSIKCVWISESFIIRLFVTGSAFWVSES